MPDTTLNKPPFKLITKPKIAVTEGSMQHDDMTPFLPVSRSFSSRFTALSSSSLDGFRSPLPREPRSEPK